MGPQAHFICPCPTLSKWVSGKSCPGLLPSPNPPPNPPTNPLQAHLSTQLCKSPYPQPPSKSTHTHLLLNIQHTTSSQSTYISKWWTSASFSKLPSVDRSARSHCTVQWLLFPALHIAQCNSNSKR